MWNGVPAGGLLVTYWIFRSFDDSKTGIFEEGKILQESQKYDRFYPNG